ncbi:MAG: class I SAM-dependent methyltransferase [Solirubrobacterales bacterium]
MSMFEAERAQAYDNRMRAAIPGYEALHQLACGMVAEETGGQGRVLVVGAGTGAECVALAEACPGVSVVGADPAEDMLEMARHKIEAHGLAARIHLHPTYVADLPRMAPFDAATLLLVMHFLPDDGAKQALLSDIAARLNPGAPLILADLFGPAWEDPWQAELRAFWGHLQRAAGIPAEDVAKGFTRVDKSIHPVTEARLAELCAAAGFEAPKPFFRALCFGGWLLRRRA